MLAFVTVMAVTLRCARPGGGWPAQQTPGGRDGRPLPPQPLVRSPGRITDAGTAIGPARAATGGVPRFGEVPSGVLLWAWTSRLAIVDHFGMPSPACGAGDRGARRCMIVGEGRSGIASSPVCARFRETVPYRTCTHLQRGLTYFVDVFGTGRRRQRPAGLPGRAPLMGPAGEPCACDGHLQRCSHVPSVLPARRGAHPGIDQRRLRRRPVLPGPTVDARRDGGVALRGAGSQLSRLARRAIIPR